MKNLVLASASPRRRDILKREGFSFEIITSDSEGEIDARSEPSKVATRCAVNKATDVFSRINREDAVVLGADTVVALDGIIYGKAKDEADARRILSLLSGKTHKVITGYCIIGKGLRECGFIESEVTFNSLSESTVKEYIKSGLWKGKAGAYGIQDGFDLIEKYSGDYDNIMGLPIASIKDEIKEFLK